MAIEYINVNGRLAKVNDEDRIEVKKMSDEIKTNLYLIKLNDKCFLNCDKEIMSIDDIEIRAEINYAYDDLDWAREVAEDVGGVIYQIVVKDMRTEK